MIGMDGFQSAGKKQPPFLLPLTFLLYSMQIIMRTLKKKIWNDGVQCTAGHLIIIGYSWRENFARHALKIWEIWAKFLAMILNLFPYFKKFEFYFFFSLYYSVDGHVRFFQGPVVTFWFSLCPEEDGIRVEWFRFHVRCLSTTVHPSYRPV